MPYLKYVRNSLLIAHDQGLLSDKELLLLLKANSSKNPKFSYEKYTWFSIESIEEPECLSEFRVAKKDLRLLADALQLPDTYNCNQRTAADKLEGLCILLGRMSFPCRYSDMLARFGRPDKFLNLEWYQIRSWITFTTYVITNCVSGIMIYWVRVSSTPTRMPNREKGLHYKIAPDL